MSFAPTRRETGSSAVIVDVGRSDRHTSWDGLVLASRDATDLVRIARERRLVVETRRGPCWVDLYWVDEVALILVDLALERRRSLSIVYPAPAGQVAVLLAAQLLLRQFMRGDRSPSLGLVTADPSQAVRTWQALRIATIGTREPISTVFPSYRAGPNGESPGGNRRLQGIIVGQRCSSWPVDYLIVDHLAGPVSLQMQQPSIELFSDPIDRALGHAASGGGLIWGWSESNLELGADLEVQEPSTVPFSVASGRLETLSRGVDVRVTVDRHPEAEVAATRVQEDLRLLRSMSPSRSDRNLERGLSVAWHHFTTLASLPCTPSRFDRFAGLPPAAARATHTFEPELVAWARTLSGDQAEVASILASDLGDLRAALDRGNPFEDSVREALSGEAETLVVTRSRTAARALLDALGAAPDIKKIANVTICSIGRLHREGTCPKVLMIGEPCPWDWHRLLSGLASRVQVLALGDRSAKDCAKMINTVRQAAEHWGDPEIRGKTWRALYGTEPPPVPDLRPMTPRVTVVADGAEYIPPIDPFEPLASLFDLDPLEVGDEGSSSVLARGNGGDEWAAQVIAVDVLTDQGRILLEAGRPVEVRVGRHLVDRRPELLVPGDILLVGRRLGRVGLLEALEERLSHRVDLVAARMLLDRYHLLVRKQFVALGLGLQGLHRRLAALGCDKTAAAVNSWVTEGTMAPRNFDDLERLNKALDLCMNTRQLQELFAGVRRRRGFRRSAGRALAAAARRATLDTDEQRVDDEIGLSVSDLRDAVIQAVVVQVAPCPTPVPLTLLGRMDT